MSNAAVQLRVNERALVKNLKMAFSASDRTWLFELLQNARRAGASEVRLLSFPEEGRFVVEDNGAGITDFQNLFSIAESGWAQEIKDSEGPYGMGFLSALFVAKKIKITSKGTRISFDTEHALSFAEITSEQVDDDGRTRIHLQGMEKHTIPSAERIQEWVSGFPIPVFLNGGELDRPHSLENMQFRKHKGSLFHLIGEFCRTFIYLQGLPVLQSVGYRNNGFVAHLDPTKFQGRMPDRDTLVDQDTASHKIYAARAEVADAILSKRIDVAIQGNQQPAFLHEYGFNILQSDLLKHRLAEFDYLPSCLFLGFIEVSAMDQHYQQFSSVSPISKASVESGQVLLFDWDSITCEEDTKSMVFVEAAKGIAVNASIPRNHWAYPYVIRSVEDVKIHCDVFAHQVLPLSFHSVDVVLCDSYKLEAKVSSNAKGEFVLPVTVDSIPFYMDTPDKLQNIDGTLYIPSGSSGDSGVLLVDYYYDDNDPTSSDEVYEEDNASVIRVVKILRGGSPADLLRDLMQSSFSAFQYKTLVGQSFKVSYDNEGNLQVVEA